MEGSVKGAVAQVRSKRSLFCGHAFGVDPIGAQRIDADEKQMPRRLGRPRAGERDESHRNDARDDTRRNRARISAGGTHRLGVLLRNAPVRRNVPAAIEDRTNEPGSGST